MVAPGGMRTGYLIEAGSKDGVVRGTFC
jgi:hypothetical protein